MCIQQAFRKTSDMVFILPKLLTMFQLFPCVFTGIAKRYERSLSPEEEFSTRAIRYDRSLSPEEEFSARARRYDRSLSPEELSARDSFLQKHGSVTSKYVREPRINYRKEEEGFYDNGRAFSNNKYNGLKSFGGYIDRGFRYEENYENPMEHFDNTRYRYVAPHLLKNKPIAKEYNHAHNLEWTSKKYRRRSLSPDGYKSATFEKRFRYDIKNKERSHHSKRARERRHDEHRRERRHEKHHRKRSPTSKSRQHSHKSDAVVRVSKKDNSPKKILEFSILLEDISSLFRSKSSIVDDESSYRFNLDDFPKLRELCTLRRKPIRHGFGIRTRRPSYSSSTSSGVYSGKSVSVESSITANNQISNFSENPAQLLHNKKVQSLLIKLSSPDHNRTRKVSACSDISSVLNASFENGYLSEESEVFPPLPIQASLTPVIERKSTPESGISATSKQSEENQIESVSDAQQLKDTSLSSAICTHLEVLTKSPSNKPLEIISPSSISNEQTNGGNLTDIPNMISETKKITTNEKNMLIEVNFFFNFGEVIFHIGRNKNYCENKICSEGSFVEVGI